MKGGHLLSRRFAGGYLGLCETQENAEAVFLLQKGRFFVAFISRASSLKFTFKVTVEGQGMKSDAGYALSHKDRPIEG